MCSRAAFRVTRGALRGRTRAACCWRLSPSCMTRHGMRHERKPPLLPRRGRKAHHQDRGLCREGKGRGTRQLLQLMPGVAVESAARGAVAGPGRAKIYSSVHSLYSGRMATAVTVSAAAAGAGFWAVGVLVQEGWALQPPTQPSNTVGTSPAVLALTIHVDSPRRRHAGQQGHDQQAGGEARHLVRGTGWWRAIGKRWEAEIGSGCHHPNQRWVGQQAEQANAGPYFFLARSQR